MYVVCHCGEDLWYKPYNTGVSQVKPSNCFRLHPTSMISKHSSIPVPDSLEKLVLHSIFDTSDDVKLAVFQHQFRMKECGILVGGQNITNKPLLHIFRGQDPPHSAGSTPPPSPHKSYTQCKCFNIRHI